MRSARSSQKILQPWDRKPGPNERQIWNPGDWNRRDEQLTAPDGDQFPL